MKICFEQFLSGRHSWGVVGQNQARSLIKLGHQVHLKSTNGYDNFPIDLLPFITNQLDSFYDTSISYTAPINFERYLHRSSKNRFGQWTSEWLNLPDGFARNHVFTDKILVPSMFSKQGFVNSKVPERKVVVVPHGINLEDYNNKNKYPLKTKKTKKILVNIGQQHLRKNISGMFESYGLAFTKQDDVCLVAKIYTKKIECAFEVDVKKIYSEFIKKYPNHAEVELITEYIPSMIELYNACDIVYTLSHCEGFYMPGVEAFGAQKLVIAPRYGGQLDFLNDDNSLLIEGKIVRSPKHYQYWTPNVHNTHFESSLEDAAHKLRQAISQYDMLMFKFISSIKSTREKYTWDNTAKQIMELCS
jgi:glycosyltransferase involved in cell wall biosynthesis